MSALLTRLEAALREGALEAIDLHFCRAIAAWGGDDERVVLAAALVSRLAGDGHVCADLAALAGTAVEFAPELVCPDYANWVAALDASAAVGGPGDYAPLILDGARLYLGRQWQHEAVVASQLMSRMGLGGGVSAAAEALLDRLLPAAEVAHAGQRQAVRTALGAGVCLISGGPGTGKTTTLAVLLATAAAATPPRILLAAPTGKAAARMEEAMHSARQRLDLPANLSAALLARAQTLHRLLGLRRDGGARHDADHPLACDLLVIDEASMVDLSLMARVLAALPPTARLVLLGDRDQLASVEAGAVFADLCLAASRGGVLAPGYAPLSHSFRFGGSIGGLAVALRAGDADQAVALLKADRDQLVWHDAPERAALLQATRAGYADYLAALAGGAMPEQLHGHFSRFRLLLAHREGPWGVRSLNAAIDQHFALARQAPWYAGRPVMVSANDYSRALFNGDIGIAAADPASGELKVWFAGENGLRGIAPERLPACETAWAMTVHKSQGSEFERVLLALPDQPSPLVTRELVYTGISRARSAVSLWATEPILREACQRRIRRHSGLAERLGASSMEKS